MAEQEQKIVTRAAHEPPKAPTHTGKAELEPQERRMFARGLGLLSEAGIPFVFASAFAKHAYTGIWRNTKDLDVFLKASDLRKAFDVLGPDGFETWVKLKHLS